MSNKCISLFTFVNFMNHILSASLLLFHVLCIIAELFIRAVSSNKLLGLFGQELSMPCTGFPYSERSMDMVDPIVIIVSHSGGTFGPLACSNLLQSFSQSIFCVTSEWDTQIGKQLRSMYSDDLLSSRIFSTEVGVRPAEPCSVSVAATHQLLTNIFEHICITICSNSSFCKISGAVITSRDLQVLERCNQRNITALEEIVGIDRKGNEIHERRSKTESELREAGDLWSEHILENAKAYIMSFFYVVITVTTGYPLVSGSWVGFLLWLPMNLCHRYIESIKVVFRVSSIQHDRIQ